MISKQFGIVVHRSIIYALLLAGSLVMLLPFFWMLSTALKAQWQVYAWPPVWIPNPLQLDNFTYIFTRLPFGQWTFNTAFIAITSTFGTLLSCSLSAYGFARFRAPGRGLLFVVLLSTMMLPFTVTMIPLFYLFKTLEWTNTFLPLIVPSFFGGAFSIFLLRQFFMTMPIELEESARIDGLNTIGIFLRIILPLTMPALTTVAIFHFNATWNDFMGPLLYLSRQDLFTLALGINFFKGQYEVMWNYLMAASIVAMMPSLILFFIGQKYFVESISLTGIKG